MPLASVRGHQEVLGRANGCKAKRERGPLQATRRGGVQIAVLQFDLGAERGERRDMQVHGPGPDGAAARQRHYGLSVARQKRPQHQVRGAHFAHDVVIGGESVGAAAGKRNDLPVLQDRGLGPKRAEQRRHGGDIVQARGVHQRQRLVAEKGRGHQGKAGVFRPSDRDLPAQFAAALYDDTIHNLLLPYGFFVFLSARARAWALRRPRLAFNAAFSRASRSGLADFFGFFCCGDVI